MGVTFSVDDDTDVSEIVKMEVSSVDAVENPANGVPWLLLKSVAKSDSQEADAIQYEVTGEIAEPADGTQPRHPVSGQFQAAKRVLEDPNAPLSARLLARRALKESNNDGDLTAEQIVPTGTVDADDITAIPDGGKVSAEFLNKQAKGGTVSPLTKQLDKLEKAIEAETDPRKLDAARAALTYGRLRQHFEARLGAAAIIKASRAEAELDASNAAVRSAQATASVPANHIAGAGAQLGAARDNRYTPGTLGTPSGANGGDFSGSRIGRVEDDPAVVVPKLETELAAKGVRPEERAHLQERLTLARLRALYASRRVA